MGKDGWLTGIVSAIWAALALLYAFVPMSDMPGGALVGASGAATFLGLTALIGRTEWRPARRHVGAGSRVDGVMIR